MTAQTSAPTPLDQAAQEAAAKDKRGATWTGDWTPPTYEERQRSVELGFIRGFKEGAAFASREPQPAEYRRGYEDGHAVGKEGTEYRLAAQSREPQPADDKCPSCGCDLGKESHRVGCRSVHKSCTQSLGPRVEKLLKAARWACSLDAHAGCTCALCEATAAFSQPTDGRTTDGA